MLYIIYYIIYNMYNVIVFNYQEKESKIHYSDSLYNCIEYMYEKAFSYVLENQGINYGDDINDFIYEYKTSPDINRLFESGTFYIEKNRNNLYGISIKEKRKEYGYIFNSYQIIKHKKIFIAKSSLPSFIPETISGYLTHDDNYSKLIKEYVDNISVLKNTFKSLN